MKLRDRYRWLRLQLGLSMRGKKDDLAMWVAWHLPRRVVMWCYVRVGAHATTGQFGTTVVPDLGMMEALKRWDEPHFDVSGRA